jgi:hypothetical protein
MALPASAGQLSSRPLARSLQSERTVMKLTLWLLEDAKPTRVLATPVCEILVSRLSGPLRLLAGVVL